MLTAYYLSSAYLAFVITCYQFYIGHSHVPVSGKHHSRRVNNMTRYILRDEYFGATLYDRKLLKHKFLQQEELSTATNLAEGVQYWQAMTDHSTTGILYSPIRVYFELTLKCNLRCRLCYNSSGTARAKELTTQQVIDSLYKLRQANVLDVRFTGGEFSQRPDWFEIFSEAKKQGFALSCNTNGVYDDESVVEKLASLDLEQITISIDGTRANHDKHRGKGSFDRTINALKALHRKGTNLRINTLISQWSVNDLEDMLEIASEYTTEINFFTYRFSGRALSQLDNAIDFDSFFEMAQQAEHIRSRYPHLHIMHFSEAFRENSIHDRRALGLRVGAPDGFTRFNIISDGTMWAGGYIPYIDPSWNLGNICTHDLLEVWHNNPKLEEYRQASQKLKVLCFDCPEYGGKCPGANYEFELVRLLNPEVSNPFCRFGNGPSLLSPDILNREKSVWG